MNRFFIEPSRISGDRITIVGDDVNHIENVLRLKRGEQVELVCETDGLTYTCAIEELARDAVICRIEDVQSESRELPIAITLYQGLPKSDKLEFVIQKTVEMGAIRIVPTVMKRSVVRVDESKIDKKTVRWNGIAESAAKQSKRSVIPKVERPMSFAEAVADAGECDAILLPYELADDMDGTRNILEALRASKVKSIAVFIGPEGGFDVSEVSTLEAAGARIITLGNRILRAETAPIAVLAWLTFLFEQ